MKKAIHPSIIFEVEISYIRHQEAIVGISGWLEPDDGKIIANISEYKERWEISEIGAHDDRDFREDTYKAKVIAQLSEQALDHIESRRMADRKGDVKFTLCLIVKYLWIERRSGPIVSLSVGEGLLKKEDIRIPSSYWIHKYAPKLGIGEYFVVEIPKGEKEIEEAWNYVEKAEECFRNWDISGVCDNCRKTGTVLDKVVKEKFGQDSFTYNERWGRAYLRFFNYMVSLGLHLEDMRGKNWEDLVKGLPKGLPHPKKRADYPEDEIKRFGKADAEHMLIVTKALIKYAEELLREMSNEVSNRT